MGRETRGEVSHTFAISSPFSNTPDKDQEWTVHRSFQFSLFLWQTTFAKLLIFVNTSQSLISLLMEGVITGAFRHVCTQLVYLQSCLHSIVCTHVCVRGKLNIAIFSEVPSSSGSTFGTMMDGYEYRLLAAFLYIPLKTTTNNDIHEYRLSVCIHPQYNYVKPAEGAGKR